MTSQPVEERRHEDGPDQERDPGHRRQQASRGPGPIVLTTLPLDPDARRRIEEAGVGRLVAAAPGRFDSADLAAADVWLGPGIRPADVERAPRLRWVQAVSAGVDNFLFPELLDSDVILTNARGLHAAAVADHAMLFVLAFARRLPAFVRAQDRVEWAAGGHLRRIDGTRMVIVGVGAIGEAIATRAVGFGIDVRGVRRTRNPSARPLPFPTVEVGRLDDELRQADWVVLAMPLTAETRHIIGSRQLQAMPGSAFLVNIGRGALVDESALIDALRAGTIAGAGLDVFEHEPLPADSPLWSMANVIITPHVAGDTQDVPQREVEVFLDNLGRFLAGTPLQNVIDKHAGY